MHTRKRQMYFVPVVTVALVLVLGGMALAQSNPLIGTWKVNLAKSKYDPGPPPMSETWVFEAWETDGVKLTATGVQADGTRATAGFSGHYDGKDYKNTGNPDIDTAVLKRVNANTTTFTGKKSGKVVGTGKLVVSKNGKMMNVTGTFMNAKGQKVHNVTVFEKQ